MSRPLAEFTASNPAEMRKVLRALVDASGMSRRKFDELAGLPAGYTDKLLCEPPIRNIGPTTLFPILWALSQRIVFVPDHEGRRKIEAHHMFETRDERQRRGDEHWRNAKVLGMVKETLRKNGSRGGKARFAGMSPKELKRHQRKAAKARWQAHRHRLRLEAEKLDNGQADPA